MEDDAGMTEKMKLAKETLEQSGAACAAVTREGKILYSHENGIRPVLSWLAQDAGLLKGACAADRVVGKAAALLMIYGGVSEIYAQVMSGPAAEFLRKNGVAFSFGKQVPYILNDDGTDLCPMEKRCAGVDSPAEAYEMFGSVAGKGRTERKSILIVVDYQKDFVDGTLGFPGAEKLEPAIAEKIVLRRKQGWTLAFTFDTHGSTYLQTQEGKKLPVEHCLRGTPGWELYGKIAGMKREGDPCFEKPAFGSMELAEYLARERYGRVELVGLVSNICVVSNAVLAKAALPEAEVEVDAACTGSGDETLNREALDVMQGLQITVTNR